MSIKRALKLINKFAAIPVYNKCKKCGDADPYLGESGLCYKCFDSIKEKKKEDSLAVKFNKSVANEGQKKKQSARSIIARLQRESDTNFEEIHINGFVITIIAGKDNSLSCEPHMIYKDIDDYESVSAFIETDPELTTIYPNENPKFKDKSWAKYFKPYSYSGNYMPIPQVEKMITDLQNV